MNDPSINHYGDLLNCGRQGEWDGLLVCAVQCRMPRSSFQHCFWHQSIGLATTHYWFRTIVVVRWARPNGKDLSFATEKPIFPPESSMEICGGQQADPDGHFVGASVSHADIKLPTFSPSHRLLPHPPTRGTRKSQRLKAAFARFNEKVVSPLNGAGVHF